MEITIPDYWIWHSTFINYSLNKKIISRIITTFTTVNQSIGQMAKITVQNADISVVKYNEEDYISLTDMARSQLQEHIIFRWLSLKRTIEYLGEWEILYNPDFNCTEFGTIKNAAGSNNFVLSVKTWIERTNAIGNMKGLYLGIGIRKK